MAQLHETTIGQRFFNGTLPGLVRELSTLNERLEILSEKLPAPETASADKHILIRNAYSACMALLNSDPLWENCNETDEEIFAEAKNLIDAVDNAGYMD